MLRLSGTVSIVREQAVLWLHPGENEKPYQPITAASSPPKITPTLYHALSTT